MKPHAKLKKAKVWMLIQNYEHLTSFINSIHASYVWLYISLDVMVKTHKVPSIDFLTKAKPKNQIRL